ncbi:MAG: nucleotidyltransferase family protein [bacterium]|nr:nucleotidyltransferase family protein [bacterium]
MRKSYPKLFGTEPLSKEEKLVIQLLKGDFEQFHSLLTNGEINWDLLVAYARRRHALFSLFRYLNHHQNCTLVPKSKLDEIKFYSYRRLAELTLIETKVIKSVLAELDKKNVDVTLIKGFALQSLCKDPMTRDPGGDLDLFVRPSSIRLMEDVLHAQGFSIRARGYPIWYVNYTNYIRYEKSTPHLLLVDVFANPFPALSIEPLYRIWWKNRIPISGDWGSAFTLCPEDQLIYLFLHCAHSHYFNGLYILKDTLQLLSSYAINWEYIIRVSKKYGIKSFVYFVLKDIAHFLEKGTPSYVLHSLKPWWVWEKSFYYLNKKSYPSHQLAKFFHWLIILLLLDTVWKRIIVIGRRMGIVRLTTF